jgi:hypothetical protein
MKERRSTSRGFCLPATFRPQGLATLSTVSSLRTRAGFVSRRQRSWDSPFGAFPSQEASATFPKRIDPPAVSPRGDAPTRGRDQPARPRLLGLDPPESPSRPDTFLAYRPPDAPLGFSLPGPTGEDLAAGFRPGSSHALSRAETRSTRPAPQSINRPPLGPARQTPKAPIGRDNPLRVLAPVRS